MIEMDFSESETISKFFLSHEQVRILIGPVGSGKTTACCAEVMRRALEQEPAPDGYRYFKIGIIRNTMPELWSTTIETWLAIFPENSCSRLRRSSPISYKTIIPPNGDEPGIHFTADFFSLDKPKDIRKLLSYECTMLYFNEVREIPRSIIFAATDRIGRYPSMKKGNVNPSWIGIIADTNPPDEDHWLYEMEYLTPNPHVKFFHQPPGVLEVDSNNKSMESNDVFEPEKVVESAGTRWAVNPLADNLKNLPIDTRISEKGDYLGVGSYYAMRVQGKTRDWIRSYYQGYYGFVQEGKPVIPEFTPESMLIEGDTFTDGLWFGGLDIGGGTLNPAAVIGQIHKNGTYIIHEEVYIDDIGLERFTRALLFKLEQMFAGTAIPPIRFFGDPAGNKRDEIFEVTSFQHLRKHGLNVIASSIQDPKLRIEATRAPMLRYNHGKPGILVNKKCKFLIKGLNGAWNYKRMNVPGSEAYADRPNKNIYSHVCDALGYALCGCGEGKRLRNAGETIKPEIGKMRFTR